VVERVAGLKDLAAQDGHRDHAFTVVVKTVRVAPRLDVDGDVENTGRHDRNIPEAQETRHCQEGEQPPLPVP